MNKKEIGSAINLSGAEKLVDKKSGNIRIYPGSMEFREGKNYALGSRTVAVVGIGDNISEARKKSLEGISAIDGGALWNRNDIALEAHISKSIMHINELRGR